MGTIAQLVHFATIWSKANFVYKYESVPHLSNGAIGKDISGNHRQEYSKDNRITPQVAGRSSEDE